MEARVFTKGILKSTNTMAAVMGYNRVVDDEFLNKLPEKFYAPTYVLLHEHKAGKPCEPHVRCVFKEADAMFTIDVEMGCWDMLPAATEFTNTVRSVEQRRADGDTNV